MAYMKVTLVLSSGSRIGPGKAALLESIRSTGSISAAARAMGMDYKRAWLLIDSLNQAFKSPAVERMAGGSGGGGAVLTALGAELVTRYRRLEGKVNKAATVDLEALERLASRRATPKI